MEVVQGQDGKADPLLPGDGHLGPACQGPWLTVCCTGAELGFLSELMELGSSERTGGLRIKLEPLLTNAQWKHSSPAGQINT